jgi:hypothetical protein
VNCRLNTVLRNLVHSYGYDLAMLRRQFGEKLFCRQDIPLPLSATQAFVPIKMRCPFSEKDGATGYVNICAVRAVVSASEQQEGAIAACHLELAGGHTLPSLFSAENTEGRLNKARLAHELYFHLHGHYGRENHYQVAEQAEQDHLYRVRRLRRRFRTLQPPLQLKPGE